MKDHYAILQCTPLSSLQEIRRQYRKLAQLHHPDKNPHDPYASARFQDILEAYETLSRPDKKAQWLEERWLRQFHQQSTGDAQFLTPHGILQKVVAFDRYLSTQDAFRSDKLGLSRQLLQLVSTEHLQCLQQYPEPEVSKTIIHFLLAAAKQVDYPSLSELWPKLESLAGEEITLIKQIQQTKQSIDNQRRLDALTIPVLLLTTAILCLCIYLFSK